MGSCGLDSCCLGWYPVAGYCEHDNEPSDSIKGGNLLTSLATVSLSRRTLLHWASH